MLTKLHDCCVHIRGRSSAVDPGSHRPSEGPLGPGGAFPFPWGRCGQARLTDFGGADGSMQPLAAVRSRVSSISESSSREWWHSRRLLGPAERPAPHGGAPKARDLTARTRADQSSMFPRHASFPRCASSSDTVERSSPRFHKLARSADRSDRHTLARMGIGASTRLIGCWVGRRPTDVYAKPYFFMSSG
jgi:hypothetical protein